jgi:ABC-type transporter Mla subunit MlaD
MATTIRSSRGATPSPRVTLPRRTDETSVLTRWMWVWVAIGILVVAVVVAFLMGIDSALGVADRSVTGAGGDVVPLPQHIAHVNATLGSIDTALKPIPAQADTVIHNLNTIDGSLGSIDGSLKDTSGTLVRTSSSLVDTSNSLIDTSGSLADTSGILKHVSGSLVDTSNVLVSILGQATTIKGTLEDLQNPADKLGSRNILDRVNTANGLLTPAKGDTGNILGGLQNVNASLKSVCAKIAGVPRPCN